MNNSLPKRKLIRLPEYDYSQNGMYFITLCAKDKQKLFGAIDESGKCILSDCGTLIDTAIINMENIYKFIKVDKYVIMPNHLHIILNIDKNASVHSSVSIVINQFKGHIAKQAGYPVWQKSFYDHIIRDDNDYRLIWQYIDDNPRKWIEDYYYN